MCRTGHVDEPRPQTPLPDHGPRFAPVSFQAVHPMPQRPSIVRSQAFGIPHLEALPRHLFDHRGDMRELAAREDILIDELADAAAELSVAQRVRRDAVVQHQAARPQQPMDLGEVGWQVALAHVLEHADARDLVETLIVGNVAVILQPDLTASGETELRDARADVFMLIPAQRDADRLDPVVAYRPEDQATPAAADVEQAFARFEHELAANMVELLLLRQVERI